ncbi:MAG TPA: 2-oxoisovalerate dehydrogenase [Verrucomicrobiota bacterium]|nr:2-oxoisovalerate dehydrogenase [Verrucomicrobiota bacterium]HNU52872.1 2-oxoisovalerate dehydrogenase [Verrucomicrobiota bacterium]
MSEIIFEILEDESEGGFVARALGHSIVTQADTWEELRANVRDAVRCHFDEGQAPRVIRLHRVFDEVLALA